MSDLPTQGLLQQMNARHVSGEHLEVLGKRAAALFTEGRSKDLNEAVVSTVKTAGLSPEQVRRVVEFANTAAYLTEFNKEGSTHRVVDFGSSGLANPSTVIQDLNDGGGGSSYDTGSSDYNHPPPENKTASVWEETAMAQMFASSGREYPEVNPLGDVIELRDKLAGAYETTTSMLSSLEVMYDDISNNMFHQVKQAALAGHSLGEIAQIWQRVAGDEYVKTAFAGMFDRLVDNGVFHNHEELVGSLTKSASIGMVNPEHPLLTTFQEYCEVVEKLAETRGAQQELGEGVAQLTDFLKSAGTKKDVAKGLVDYAGHAINTAADYARKGGETAGKVLFGGEGKGTGEAAHFATKYVVPLAAANEVYRHTLKHSPTAKAVGNALVSAVPGTDAYRQKELELELRAQGMGGYR